MQRQIRSSNARGRTPSRAPPVPRVFLFTFQRNLLLSSSLLSSLFAGCGYALVGTGRGVLPRTSDVCVETFVNETPRSASSRCSPTRSCASWPARGRLKPVADRSGADVELAGTPASQVYPVRFDDQGRAIEYQISVTANVVIADDRKTEKPLFEDPSFLFRQPYPVAATSACYDDLENAAIDAWRDRSRRAS